MIRLTNNVRRKVNQDLFYKTLFKQTSDIDALERAGFFDDKLEPEVVEKLRHDTQLLTTPLHKILSNLHKKTSKISPSVLVATGAFSPLHKGHIAMMEQAKRALEEKGEVVVGGYITPGHDSYVSFKKNGTAAMDAILRVEAAQISLDESDWLMVDPWPALYVEKEINFTTVLERTSNYLIRHIPNTPIKIWYVYGQDNEGFKDAFISIAGAVCVGRDDLTSTVKTATKNVVYAINSSPYKYASSTKVRQGDTALLHEGARNYTKKNTPLRTGSYGLRNDITWATSTWNVKARYDFHDEFMDKLKILMSRAFSEKMPIEVFSLDTQQTYLDSLTKKYSVLNLDVCLSGGERFDVSRLFNVADYQSSSSALINRPYSPDLTTQAKSLLRKKYIYFDDDIVSGKTLRRVTNLLKQQKIAITDSASSLKASGFGKDGSSLYDIDDARDFLLGAASGGLVVTLPNGKLGRVPYMAPYVCLTTRASIPTQNSRAFSAGLWNLNATILKKYAPNIRVKDADPATRDFLRYSGFTNNTPLYKVAEVHEKLFRNN